MNYLIQAINELAPGANFHSKGNGIVWESTDISMPSEEAIKAKEQELAAAEPMKQLRELRNRLIIETDWLAARASDGPEIPAEWKTYRQQLRDLPATAEPKLENGMLTNVTWPEKPE